jgi:hypothetical protein
MKMSGKETSTHDENDDVENEGLSRVDQQELFSCEYNDSEDETDELTNSRAQEPRQSEDKQDCDESHPTALLEQTLRTAVSGEHQNIFRIRLLKRLLSSAQAKMQREKTTEEQQKQRDLRRKYIWLRDLGLSEEEITQVKDPYAELPTVINEKVNKKLAERRQEQNEKQQRAKEKKVKKMFSQGSWLRRVELQLHENVEIVNSSCESSSTLEGAKGMIEVLTHKLKSYHETMGTIMLKEAIEERKRVCVHLGILSEANKHLVTNLVDQLPFEPVEHQEENEEDESEEDKDEGEDDEDDFETPPSSQQELMELQ